MPELTARSISGCWIVAFVFLQAVSSGKAFGQQLSGLSVGDNISQTESLGFAPSEVNRSGAFVIAKWEMPDGNSLSVTALADGTIVYLESDWGHGISGRFTDFPGIVFGKTSLRDIRNLTGSNGFCFTGTGCVSDSGNGVINFNSYGISEKPDVVVTFITVSEYATAANGNEDALLDAIIVAYKPYLHGIWGEETISDPKYNPITVE